LSVSRASDGKSRGVRGMSVHDLNAFTLDESPQSEHCEGIELANRRARKKRGGLAAQRGLPVAHPVVPQ
jgi:hypothetical protein